MKIIKFTLIIWLALCSVSIGISQNIKKAENVILITLDGVRWQDVFGGADSVILFNEKFAKSEARRLTGKFSDPSYIKRREKTMPFLWSTIASQGRIYGNRWKGNKVNISNPYSISYPGYSEIFTGYADPAINSNDLNYNPNSNVFEFVNQQKGFEGKVASFASWDRAKGFLNNKQSTFFINGGYDPVEAPYLSPLQQTLNNLQKLHHTLEQSRPDYITYLLAKEHIRLHQPRLLSIGFAWSDDMAHDGSYPLYLEKMFYFDAMIQDLWEYLNSIPQYKDNTVIIITVDHGRGLSEQWTGHGSKIKSADEIWFAIMGPGISPKGEMTNEVNLYQPLFS